MGEVYRARDTRLEREVAVKVLSERIAGDSQALLRFEREAKAVAALSHPNILAIHDLGSQDGVAFAAMELLEGETLRDRLDQGSLPARKAVDFALQIVQGLAAAHERGIVHRDLKPENVFLTRDGHLKILDFGLHRQLGPAQSEEGTQSPTRSRHTGPGTVLGTAGYMSPEQVRGLEADHRSDLFSFGCVLYEMLSGRRAFRRDSSVETMSAILKEEPPPISEPSAQIAPELERIVTHCLEKRPEDRFQSARDLAFDLAHAGGASDRSGPKAVPPSRRKRTGPLAAASTLVLAVPLAFFGGRLFERGRRVETSPAAPESYLQVTDQSGVEAQPSLSPDGKSVVYVSRASGNDDIYLQRVGGGAAINLTADSADDDSAPAFSPEGERIAFHSSRSGGGIFVMGTAGESVRRLTDFGRHVSWSPDGKEIVVSIAGFTDPYNRMTGGGELFAVDAVSGKRRAILDAGDAVQPSWSPHGTRIAYWGLRLSVGGQRDLWTVAADGSELKGGVSVTDDNALDWNPVWSADGRFLYFSSDRGGSMNLWRIPIDEGSGRVQGAPESVTTPSGWTGGISVSKDGKRLAFATLDWRSTLQRVAFDSATGTLRGRPERFVSSTQPIRDHEVSPDGQWVAYTRTVAQEDIFVARTDGSSYRRLTDDAFRDRGPAWSPDGKRIAFYSDRGGKYEVWTIRPDGSGLQQLTRSKPSLNFPVWAPDGTRIATPTSRREGWFVIDTAREPGANTDAPMASNPDGTQFYPLSWSRDGASLIGTRLDAVSSPLGLTRFWLTSGRYENVYDTTSPWLFPVFLADGRRALVRDKDGVLLIDLQTKQAKRLLAVQGQFTGKSVGITRDEKFITFTETADEGNIWLASFR
jgi:Tol biopolymer transport system component/serine/threonine protein kinase